MGKFMDRLAGVGGGNLPVGLFVFAAITVVGVQIISVILTQLFGLTQLALGPALGLLAIVAILVAAFMAAMSPEAFSGETWLAVGLLVGVIIFLFLLFPKLAPEFFRPPMSALKIQLMSVLGM